MPMMASTSPMESHILLPVMKLPGIRFMPCPVQTPPRIRAITPTVIKVSRLKLLLMSHKVLGPADLSSAGVPIREVGQNAVSGRLAADFRSFDLGAQQCLDEVREVDDGRRRQDDIAGGHPDRHVTHPVPLYPSASSSVLGFFGRADEDDAEAVFGRGVP